MPKNKSGKSTRLSKSPRSRNERVVDSSIEILLEPIYSDSYHLTYTCFLIPLIPSIKLPKSLVAPLTGLIKEICLTNKWKLEFVNVNSRYLQWALTVPISVPTTQIVQQVRTRSSKAIIDNPGRNMVLKNIPDYWAPGYLLLYGLHSRPAKTIEQYIRMVNRQLR